MHFMMISCFVVILCAAFAVFVQRNWPGQQPEVMPCRWKQTDSVMRVCYADETTVVTVNGKNYTVEAGDHIKIGIVDRAPTTIETDKPMLGCFEEPLPDPRGHQMDKMPCCEAENVSVGQMHVRKSAVARRKRSSLYTPAEDNCMYCVPKFPLVKDDIVSTDVSVDDTNGNQLEISMYCEYEFMPQNVINMCRAARGNRKAVGVRHQLKFYRILFLSTDTIVDGSSIDITFRLAAFPKSVVVNPQH